MEKTMTALLIMDGFGINPAHDGNAIYQAGTPHLDELMRVYPHTQIGASGLNVGLPDGQMGNSEVGHLNIGAGRIVYQELTRITKDIQDGEFFEKKPLQKVMDEAVANGKAIHLMGLVSDGGVHSHNTHLYALLEMCKQRGVKNVFVHAFLDGRDVPPTSGLDFIKELDAKLAEIGVGKIATVMGRYWAMDRDNLWDRVQKAYDAMTHFPPLLIDYQDTEFTALLEAFSVQLCVYGHLHGTGIGNGFNGCHHGVEYRLVSCDAINFSPVKIWDRVEATSI